MSKPRKYIVKKVTWAYAEKDHLRVLAHRFKIDGLGNLLFVDEKGVAIVAVAAGEWRYVEEE